MSHHDHDHDPLWQVLGRARATEVSPFFARNVTRAVRGLRQESSGQVPGWMLTLLRYWQLPALGVCAIAIAAGAMHHRHSPVSDASADPQMLAIAQKVSASPDFGVIGHLDELMEAEQNSVWLAGEVY